MKGSGEKGISVFTSHVIAIAILFVILIVVSSSIFSYYYSIKEEVQASQAKALCQRIADNVLKLYTEYNRSDYRPWEGENDTLSEVYLNIPEKISGNGYTLSLRQRGDLWIEGTMENETAYKNERPYTSVRVDVEGNPSAVYSYPIYNMVLANVSGSVRKATVIKISYLREKESGEIRDYIIMERFS